MRLRLLAICALAAFATSGFAKDVYLSIGGSVGVFHTDTRIFNPSSTKDIQIQAYLLPPNSDNSVVQPITITVPKRQMLDYNDVVQSLFNNTSVSLAAIRLKSDDDFVATQRIYAQQSATSSCNIAGTLGQFVPGLDVSTAAKQGVLIQLKSTQAFRTNIGVVNPNATAANVTWKLYDKNNAVVGTVNTAAMPATLQPFGVVTPVNLSNVFNAPGADLSDAWVSFVSDQPIFAYASVVDNFTTDPTFITMSLDSGIVATSPTTPSSKTYNIMEQNFQITITPPIGLNDLNIGDTVTFHITVRDSDHGFELIDPVGAIVVQPAIFFGGQVIDKTWTVTKKGTYQYFCTNPSCGIGHDSMSGTFDVQMATEPGGGPRY
jgi:hypothetical protein